ncbi:MAG: hypothetical protein M5U09_05300 [Gammaproteobacteria bacterium]|nr:hypothetical protein [Gammaproteobacteria bacterium]
MIMEGSTTTPWSSDLVTDLAWRPEMPELKPWVADYVHRRYGRPSAAHEGGVEHPP